MANKKRQTLRSNVPEWSLLTIKEKIKGVHAQFTVKYAREHLLTLLKQL